MAIKESGSIELNLAIDGAPKSSSHHSGLRKGPPKEPMQQTAFGPPLIGNPFGRSHAQT